MVQHLHCFGDSWGYGSELAFHKNEKPFARLLSKHFKCGLTNHAWPNRSLGLITRDIAEHVGKIHPDDLVLVVIPPDSRWYTEWETLDYAKDPFFLDKSNDWFEYHHQLFIFSICEMLEKIKCRYLLMHNYGKFPLDSEKYYFSNFHRDKFLSKDSLTDLLTEKKLNLSPIEAETQMMKHFKGKYFEGCKFHPNQLGHQRIADLIVEKLKSGNPV